MAGSVIGVLFGLFLLFLVGQAFWKQIRFLLTVGLRMVLGGLFLLLVNYCAGPMGFTIGVNPASILTLGLLGFPGFLLLAALKFLV
ncbi:MAG TPA: SigmaK-factor processing regulatory BofA [Syntrophaceticus sp.]|nr:SigmaK-factor processing regulatory BofA [Syntrophaceticus sp.]